MKKTSKIDTLVFVGFGAVGTAILEVFNLENKFLDRNFIIIEP